MPDTPETPLAFPFDMEKQYKSPGASWNEVDPATAYYFIGDNRRNMEEVIARLRDGEEIETEFAYYRMQDDDNE